MSKINNDSLRTPFFPNRSPQKKLTKGSKSTTRGLERNDAERKVELDNISKNHTKVSIDSKIKDFSRIKKAVDQAPDISRDAYIANLKNKINAGEYSIDPEKIAEKMLISEF